MAFMKSCAKKISKKLVFGLLVASVSVWMIYLALQPFLYPTLRIKDYFSSDAREETLNKGRHYKYYLPIHAPVITPSGFNSRFLLIILVVSSPSNIQKRSTIRKTWGRDKNWDFFGRRPEVLRKQSYRTAFVVGTSSSQNTTLEIRKEITTYHDILLGNFTDSYKSLYIKVFMAFEWSLSIKCKYILKADDDVYINVPLLSMWLNNRNSRTSKDLYSGLVYLRALPERNISSKHFLPNRLYSLDVFPPYCAGPSYIFSWDLVSRILNASRVILPLRIEDAYMGMLAYYLGVSPLHHEGFRLRFDNVSRSEMLQNAECSFLTTFSYGHDLSPKDLIRLHDVARKLDSRRRGQLHCFSVSNRMVPFLWFCITGIVLGLGFGWIRSIMLKQRI